MSLTDHAPSQAMSETKGGRVPGAAKWTGRVMSGIVILFLAMDITMKLANLAVVTQANLELGWQPDMPRILGVILLACTVLYVYPRTAILGAILLTGYLGGAVAAHLRIDSPLFTHVLFGVYLGILAWGGLWLRDPRLQGLFPLRRP
jgi:DoxX-like family